MKFRIGILVAALMVGAVAGIAGEAPRPNIIQIMADDLGWGAVGYNGQKFVKTPNIDRLARNGMVFDRAYAAPVCSPTRASLQVGFHAGHTWTDRNIRWPAKGFREGSVTIGDVLQEAGYVTGAFGKWGFGGSKGQGDILHSNPVIDNPMTLPTSQGYDAFFGCLDHVRAHTFFMDSLWEDASEAEHGVKLTPTGNTPDEPFTRFCDDLYAERALEFVRTYAESRKPFYLQLHFQTPHAPLNQITNLDGWFDAYADADTSDWCEGAKQYAAMVTRMDRHIGRLIELLGDTHRHGRGNGSVLENTLVLFTSDNGGYRGPQFTEKFRLNGPLRKGKGSLYEGGIRVPLVAYWPERIEAGSVSHRPVDITDELPTFADLAGVPPPVGIDGVSFAPTLLREGRQRSRPYLAFEDHEDWAIVKGKMKLIRFSRNGGEYALYNLEEDPGEEHNLLRDKEAPAYEDYVDVKQELERVAEEEGVTHGDAIGKAWARKNGNDRGRPYYVRYPKWQGKDGGRLGVASNWSLKEPPAETWVVNFANPEGLDRTAFVDQAVRVLGIEIGGGTGRTTLKVRSDGRLAARNGIRVSKNGSLELEGGVIETHRRLEVRAGGRVGGVGKVIGDVDNKGQMSTEGGITIEGDVKQAAKPNFLLIYTDDQGYGDVSAYNPNSKLETPHLDRLAREGMTFTDAHASDTVCTPSRYGLLTGRYAWRTELKRGVLGAEHNGLIEKERLTLPEMLRRDGYNTAMTGKWHLGIQFPGSKGDRDWSEPFTDGPPDHGFDYFYGIPASMNYGVLAWFEERLAEVPPTLWTQKKPNEVAMRDFRIKPPYSKTRDGGNNLEVAPNFIDIEALTRFTDKAIAWLDNVAGEARRGTPFFLYVPYTSPHKPVIPRERFRDKTEAGAYGDFIRETDWHIGRLLKKLEDEGLASETMVVVTSDNGPENTWKPRIERYGHDSSGIYRGGKRDLYEGGHRVPFLVRWPGVVKPGSVSDATICQTDLMATWADILDRELSSDAGEDSESLLPALRGKSYKKPLRGAVVHHSSAGFFAIRDGEWKLIFGRGPKGNRKPDQGESPFELYNLAVDPGETRNLYEDYPQVVKRLKQRMIEIIRRGRSTPGPVQANEGGPQWRGLGWMEEEKS